MENLSRLFNQAEKKATKFEFENIKELKKENHDRYARKFGYKYGKSITESNDVILNALNSGGTWLSIDKSAEMLNKLAHKINTGVRTGDRLDASCSGGKARNNRIATQTRIKQALEDLALIREPKKYYFYVVRMTVQDVYIAKGGKNNDISDYYLPMDSKGNNAVDTLENAKKELNIELKYQIRYGLDSFTGNVVNEHGMIANSEFGFQFEYINGLTVPKINLHAHCVLMVDSPIDFSVFNGALRQLLADKLEPMDMYIEPVYSDYHGAKHTPMVFDTAKTNNDLTQLSRLVGYVSKQYGYPNLARKMLDENGNKTTYTQAEYLRNNDNRAVELAIVAMANGIKSRPLSKKYGLFHSYSFNRNRRKAEQLRQANKLIADKKGNQPLFIIQYENYVNELTSQADLDFNFVYYEPPP